MLTLHSHIHEAPDAGGLWLNKIDSTVCLNPGQTENGSKILYYALVDLKKKKYERLK